MMPSRTVSHLKILRVPGRSTIRVKSLPLGAKIAPGRITATANAFPWSGSPRRRMCAMEPSLEGLYTAQHQLLELVGGSHRLRNNAMAFESDGS
jgi:hypothetical protein